MVAGKVAGAFVVLTAIATKTTSLYNHVRNKEDLLDGIVDVVVGEIDLAHHAMHAMVVSYDGGLGGCDDDEEYEFGLDLILDGLERLRDTA